MEQPPERTPAGYFLPLLAVIAWALLMPAATSIIFTIGVSMLLLIASAIVLPLYRKRKRQRTEQQPATELPESIAIAIPLREPVAVEKAS
ncbi:MAG TPA: hypothetical protein VFA41_03330 [Ktedonobacteraceae bacterium]|jgi:cbb3-type cytochrome oxidase subunit 3|nr:hypothetical protein [Ktedonobacteraceae bacterium]